MNQISERTKNIQPTVSPYQISRPADIMIYFLTGDHRETRHPQFPALRNRNQVRNFAQEKERKLTEFVFSKKTFSS